MKISVHLFMISERRKMKLYKNKKADVGGATAIPWGEIIGWILLLAFLGVVFFFLYPYTSDWLIKLVEKI